MTQSATELKCPACGRKFEPRRSDARTCSSVTARRHAQQHGRKSVHFSSATDLWSTLQDFFDKMNAEFHFTLDVCATAANAKCARFFSPADDGLAQQWTGTCWMNPPYGRTIGQWMAKAREAAEKGATVVCLVPARTDTRWWQDNVSKAQDVRFLRGRLKFGGATNSAPFPSAVVVFRPGCSAIMAQSATP